ncbi:MAG TPA: hypothetical protein ENF23_07400 [Methanosarcinales archaeon]|nr:hypothetical protein [Methanosarcinales archaeon]
MQVFHGHLTSAEYSARPWAVLHNFHPYSPRAKIKQTYESPVHKLNDFVYHDNWLHNLLISASTGLSSSTTENSRTGLVARFIRPTQLVGGCHLVLVLNCSICAAAAPYKRLQASLRSRILLGSRVCSSSLWVSLSLVRFESHLPPQVLWTSAPHTPLLVLASLPSVMLLWGILRALVSEFRTIPVGMCHCHRHCHRHRRLMMVRVCCQSQQWRR